MSNEDIERMLADLPPSAFAPNPEQGTEPVQPIVVPDNDEVQTQASDTEETLAPTACVHTAVRSSGS